MRQPGLRLPLRLHHRYFLAMMLLVIPAMAAVSTALILQYERSMAEVRETSCRTFAEALRHQFEQRARGLALVTAEALVNPLALLNVEAARDAIQAVSAEPDVISVSVVDHAGLGLFSGTDTTPGTYFLEQLSTSEADLAEPVLQNSEGRVEVSAPVRLGEQLLGVVTIALRAEQINRDTVGLTAQLVQLNDIASRARYRWLLAIAGMVLLGAGVLAVLMSRGLSRPIQSLAAFTAQIGHADEQPQMAVDRTDEIGGLARALESMRANLRKTMISRDTFDRILNSMQDGLLVTAPDGRITDVNHAAVVMLGIREPEIVGRPIRDLLPADLPGLSHHAAAAAPAPRENVETCLFTGSGDTMPVLLSAAAMSRNDGMPEGYVWVFHDITERKQAERQIQYMAHHDALTGLPNRILLHSRLEQAIAQARRRDEMVALLLLDLDDFKEVNDTLGHFAGDELLVAVAERITSCIRDLDSCARLGGDEFAVIQVGVRENDGIDKLCERLIEVIGQPFLVQEQEVIVGTSIGVSVYPRDGMKVEPLLKSADLALYQAKASGRRTHHFFEEELNLQLQRQKALERELRQAVQQEQFVIHFQPQMEIATGRLVGVEALIRWEHPARGLLMPDQFIPAAERTGLIVPIAEWVLSRACAIAEAWRVETGHAVRIAVNLSPAQFHYRQNLVELVATALQESGLPPCRLELEITEGVLLQHSEANLETLRHLKELGVCIGMDDFGTGFASLACLRRFPFDLIKIDRSFIRDLERASEAQAIVRAAVSLGRSLRMRCLAEGVETLEQLRFLEHEGCSEAQGFYFSRAVSESEIRQQLLVGSCAGRNVEERRNLGDRKSRIAAFG